MKKSKFVIFCLAFLFILAFLTRISIVLGEDKNPAFHILLPDQKKIYEKTIMHITEETTIPFIADDQPVPNRVVFSGRYSGYYSSIVKETKNGCYITINDIDWSSVNRNLAIIADNTLYLVKNISPEQAGKTVVIKRDDSYSELTVKAPSKIWGFINVYGDLGINETLNLSNPVSFELASFFKKNPVYIPSGKYDIVIDMEDKDSTYLLYKPDIILNNGRNAIELKKEELNKVVIVIKDNIKLKPYLNCLKFNPLTGNLSKNLSYIHASDLDPQPKYTIYYSNELQPERNIELHATAKGAMVYQVPAEIKSGSTITLGTNFSIKANLKNEGYKPGDVLVLNEDIFITDEYGNKVTGFNNYSSRSNEQLKITLTNGNKKYEKVMSIDINTHNSEITLPNTTGVYTVSISAKGLHVPVKTLNTTIKIQ